MNAIQCFSGCKAKFYHLEQLKDAMHYCFRLCIFMLTWLAGLVIGHLLHVIGTAHQTSSGGYWFLSDKPPAELKRQKLA